MYSITLLLLNLAFGLDPSGIGRIFMLHIFNYLVEIKIKKTLPKLKSWWCEYYILSLNYFTLITIKFVRLLSWCCASEQGVVPSQSFTNLLSPKPLYSIILEGSTPLDIK